MSNPSRLLKIPPNLKLQIDFANRFQHLPPELKSLMAKSGLSIQSASMKVTSQMSDGSEVEHEIVINPEGDNQ